MKCKFDVDVEFEQRLMGFKWLKKNIELQKQKCDRFIFNPKHPLTIAMSVVD